MNRKSLGSFIEVVARILLVSVFVFAQSAWAGQSQNASDKTGSARKAGAPSASEKQSPAPPAKAQSPVAQAAVTQKAVVEEIPSSGGPHEGIKVHGHWTIEVRNPDGTLVTHREFENSYLPRTFLPQVLARQASVGFWQVAIFGNGCHPAPSTNCIVAEPGSGAGGIGVFANLTIGTSGNSFVLSGTATAAATGTIAGVGAFGTNCPSTAAPSTPCVTGVGTFGGLSAFTSTNLSPAIPVSLGQIIQVNVTISFS